MTPWTIIYYILLSILMYRVSLCTFLKVPFHLLEASLYMYSLISILYCDLLETFFILITPTIYTPIYSNTNECTNMCTLLQPPILSYLHT